ncbi:hypothetical protein [Mesoplasma seiffertii]|uniref:hypothetical protein n=1 Tax=Mesoplasma seiffertii TaxID=28224 RepID=UPI00047E3313|nr:hypothetical protein [Mesoplasma seiffertii]
MKNFLSVLGAVMLTTSTGLTVIACSNSETISIPTSEETISEYKTELNNIWNTVYNQNTSKFVRKIYNEEDTENYNLFNFNYLKTHFSGSENASFNLSNDLISQTLFLRDLAILFPEDQFAKEIQSNLATGKNSVKYRNTYMGSTKATLGDFKILENSDFSLTRTNYKNLETGATELIFTINVTISRQMHYKNPQGLVEMHNVNQIPLSILIGKDGKALSIIQKVITELPKQIFANGESQFKASTFKNLYSDFKAYTKAFDLSLYDYLNSPTYKKLITKNIEILNNQENQYKLVLGDIVASAAEIKVLSEMIQNNTKENQANLETKILYDLQRNPLANSLILKKTETEVLKKDYALEMLQEIVPELDFKIDEYEENLSEFLRANIPQESINDLIETTYSYGFFRLQNIYLEFDEHSKLELPSLTIPWTYENDIVETNKKEAWLLSIYEALKIVNENVLRANSIIPTSSAPNIFAESTLINENLKASFNKPWSEIVNDTGVSSKNWNIEDDNIFDFDEGKSLITSKLVSEKSRQKIANNMQYDFDSFSADMLNTYSVDQEVNRLEYPLDYLSHLQLNVFGSNYQSNNTFELPNTSNYWVKASEYPTTYLTYKFSLSWINFSISLPFDEGYRFYDTYEPEKVWSGEKYWELSNDRSLFADSTDSEKFDWEYPNRYKLSSYNESGSIYAIPAFIMFTIKN